MIREGCRLGPAAAAGRERSRSAAALHPPQCPAQAKPAELHPPTQSGVPCVHPSWRLVLATLWGPVAEGWTGLQHLQRRLADSLRRGRRRSGGGGGQRTAGGCACLGGERKRMETFYEVHLLTAAAKIQQGAPARRLASAQQQRQALRAPVAAWEVVITLLARPRAPKWPPLPARLVGRLLSALLRLAAQQPVAREMREHLSEAHRARKPLLPLLRMPPAAAAGAGPLPPPPAQGAVSSWASLTPSKINGCSYDTVGSPVANQATKHRAAVRTPTQGVSAATPSIDSLRRSNCASHPAKASKAGGSRQPQSFCSSGRLLLLLPPLHKHLAVVGLQRAT